MMWVNIENKQKDEQLREREMRIRLKSMVYLSSDTSAKFQS